MDFALEVMENFKGKSFRALVIGDFMLDNYIFGDVKRLSPEAPVPIVNVNNEVFALGGAGNVAVNLKALGFEVLALGILGDGDERSRKMQELFWDHDVDFSRCICSANWNIPLKKRVIVNNQHLCRIDDEEFLEFSEDCFSKDYLINAIGEVDAVVISDYGKGFVSRGLLKVVFDVVKSVGVPVFVDPKGVDYRKYNGATILKPNEKELRTFLGDYSSHIENLGKILYDAIRSQYVVVTCGADGMFLFESDEKHGCRCSYSSTDAKTCKDVTGAGDTVLAVLTYCYLLNIPLPQSMEIANFAAGRVINYMGCASVTSEGLVYGLRRKLSAKSKSGN